MIMKPFKNKLKIAKGFTLVELLVVIAIIAILSVTAYVALGGQTGKARDSRRLQDLSSIQSVLELYHIENNSEYPATLDDLKADGKLTKIPLDPSVALPYAYAPSANKKQYQLGATLEGDKGVYKAYVIGNSDVGLLTGVDVVGTKGCVGASPVDGDTNCVPLQTWK